MSLPQLTENLNIVQSLPNKPTQEANELKIKFIKEQDYQKIKKRLNKTNDYFSEKEFEKIDVILT